jgi:hypothetical protein
MDQLRAHLSALMPYRVAAAVMMQLLPVDAGMSTETLRAHTLKVGQQLRAIVAVRPAQAASAATCSEPQSSAPRIAIIGGSCPRSLQRVLLRDNLDEKARQSG